MSNSAKIQIRPFLSPNRDSALTLWSSVEGLRLNESDTPEALEAFLARNPGFSAIAVDENETVVGAVLCGHNGRAGSLYHLAVAKTHRDRGIAKKLIEYCCARLNEANIPRCNIFVYDDNDGGNSFWFHNGWIDPENWKVLQKHVQI